MPSEKIEPGIRAEFKEVAREIVGRDRTARKLGVSQNTIGEIERAQVAAYRRGQSANGKLDAPSVQQPSELFADWIAIPPRCRDTLWSISCTLDKDHASYNDEPIVLEQLLSDRRPRWRQFEAGLVNHPQTFSEGGVGPLVKLGLLQSIGDEGGRLVLSSKGIAICKEYWRRWHAKDKTLPKISLRP